MPSQEQSRSENFALVGLAGGEYRPNLGEQPLWGVRILEDAAN